MERTLELETAPQLQAHSTSTVRAIYQKETNPELLRGDWGWAWGEDEGKLGAQ